jgi:glycosyltransferase involved in cell wall biosynthesis
VIPTRDRPAELDRAIASALAQDPPPFEVIVIDDGERQAVVRDQPQVRIVRRTAPRGDLGAARNLGVAEARGELIAFLDDDDVWHAGKLRRQVDALGDAAATACGFQVLDARGRVVERHLPVASDLRRELLLRPILQPSGLLVRRQVLQQVGGFAEGRGCEDWALFLRLAEHARVILQPEVMVTRRPSAKTVEEQFEALVALYEQDIAPRIAPRDRPRVEAHHRLIRGVLLARMGRRRAALRLLARSSAPWQTLRVLIGERGWATLRRLVRYAS